MTDPHDSPSAAAPRPDAASRVREPVDLADVVARLVRPGTAELLIESRSAVDGSLQLAPCRVYLPALLPALRAELAPSGEGGGGGRGGGVALAVDVSDVLRSLHEHVTDACRRLGLPARRRHRQACRRCPASLLECRHSLVPGSGRPRVGTYGTRCCSRCQHPPAPDVIADALAQLVPHPWPNPTARQAFADGLDARVRRARAILDGDAGAVYVRDTRCPVCHAEWVTVRGAGGWDRHPALRVDRARPARPGELGRVTGTTCTACELRWSWEAMHGPAPVDCLSCEATHADCAASRAASAEHAEANGEQPGHAAAGRCCPECRHPIVAGELWELLDADRYVVAAGRRLDDARRRLREQLARERAYRQPGGPTAAQLGLPH